MASNAPGPGYVWISDGSSGSDGTNGGGYWAPNQYTGTVEQPAPAANPFNGGNSSAATINANWQASPPLQAQLAALLTNPMSGYAAAPNYMPSPAFGRFQFSGTAPVPRTAPQGWGRYPGVDGAPGNAPWLQGQTMPPPVWGNTGNRPPVVVPPPVTPPTINWNPTRERVVPPPYIGGGGETRIPNPATTGTGTTRVPVVTTPNPAAINWNNGFGPNMPIGQNNQGVPAWWQGPASAWNATAGANSQGILQKSGTWSDRFKPAQVAPVPEQFKDYFIPWNYVDRALPIGAFVTLFPNERGNGWSKVKPANYGPNWRPTGPANPDGWGS